MKNAADKTRRDLNAKGRLRMDNAGAASPTQSPIESTIDWPLSAESERWRTVLTHFRNYLQKICESELVGTDQEAQRIIVGMVHCRTMTDVDAQMDRLIVRCGELLAARTGDSTELARLLSRAREGGRAAFASSGKRHNFAAEDEAPRRKFIRS
jgi:hypothetical protein